MTRVVALLLFLLLAACAPVVDDSQWRDSSADCQTDELYDPAAQICYVDLTCTQSAECIDLEATLFADAGSLGSLPAPAVVKIGNEDYVESIDDSLVYYWVDGNRIVDPEFVDADEYDLTRQEVEYQRDTSTHRRVWRAFSTLFPPDWRTLVSQFVIFSDGEGEVLAAVEPDPDDPLLWILSVDIADADNRRELAATLIHEFAHLLTLNDEQIPFDETVFENPDDETLYAEAVESCPTYYSGEGCSKRRSYINQFFEQFWMDIYDQLIELEVDTADDEDAYYDRLYEFYLDYEDQFVSDYAATNPAEDIAESWTEFVLSPKPKGDTIAEEKVLFFYAFPELVELRTYILARLKSQLRTR